MYEVEVKVAADHEVVREQLRALDAASLGLVTQVDTYLDAPHRDFAETDEALRLRRAECGEESRSILTYKGPLIDPESKTRAEIETQVSDAEAAIEILEALGFERVATVRKDREPFRVGEYTVTLDAVADLGEFVEVEREASEVDAARDGAFDVLESLGLDPTDQLRTSYLELLLHGDDSR